MDTVNEQTSATPSVRVDGSDGKRSKGPTTKLDGGETCLICGDVATGYHYGVLSCEGCKSFFRRCTLKSNVVYKCKEQGNCVLSTEAVTTRIREAASDTTVPKRKCKACRYHKCVKYGMDEHLEQRQNAKRLKRRLKSDVEMRPGETKKKVSTNGQTSSVTNGQGHATTTNGSSAKTTAVAAAVKTPSQLNHDIGLFELFPQFLADDVTTDALESIEIDRQWSSPENDGNFPFLKLPSPLFKANTPEQQTLTVCRETASITNTLTVAVADSIFASNGPVHTRGPLSSASYSGLPTGLFPPATTPFKQISRNTSQTPAAAVGQHAANTSNHNKHAQSAADIKKSPHRVKKIANRMIPLPTRTQATSEYCNELNTLYKTWAGLIRPTEAESMAFPVWSDSQTTYGMSQRCQFFTRLAILNTKIMTRQCNAIPRFRALSEHTKTTLIRCAVRDIFYLRLATAYNQSDDTMVLINETRYSKHVFYAVGHCAQYVEKIFLFAREMKALLLDTKLLALVFLILMFRCEPGHIEGATEQALVEETREHYLCLLSMHCTTAYRDRPLLFCHLMTKLTDLEDLKYLSDQQLLTSSYASKQCALLSVEYQIFFNDTSRHQIERKDFMLLAAPSSYKHLRCCEHTPYSRQSSLSERFKT